MGSGDGSEGSCYDAEVEAVAVGASPLRDAATSGSSTNAPSTIDAGSSLSALRTAASRTDPDSGESHNSIVDEGAVRGALASRKTGFALPGAINSPDSEDGEAHRAVGLSVRRSNRRSGSFELSAVSEDAGVAPDVADGLASHGGGGGPSSSSSSWPRPPKAEAGGGDELESEVGGLNVDACIRSSHCSAGSEVTEGSFGNLKRPLSLWASPPALLPPGYIPGAGVRSDVDELLDMKEEATSPKSSHSPNSPGRVAATLDCLSPKTPGGARTIRFPKLGGFSGFRGFRKSSSMESLDESVANLNSVNALDSMHDNQATTQSLGRRRRRGSWLDFEGWQRMVHFEASNVMSSRASRRVSVSLEESLAAISSARHGQSLVASQNHGFALRWCDRCLNNSIFSSFMAVLTVFVLVGDDIRLMSFEADADFVFDCITAGSFFLFSIEMILSVLVKEDYFPGFWFFADLLATASLVLDLTFVSEAILQADEIAIDRYGGGQASGRFEESEYARASRSSRVGSRIARILRVLRLARLGRVVKIMYKAASQCMLAVTKRKQLSGPGDEADSDSLLRQHAESRVGKKLSERTPQRVILIVLALLIVLPQLDPGDSYTMLPESAQYGADVVLQSWMDFEMVVAEWTRAAGVAARSASPAPAIDSIVQARWDWEVQALTYIYYHRYDELGDWLYKLAWVGYVRSKSLDNARDDGLDVAGRANLFGIGAAFSKAGSGLDGLTPSSSSSSAASSSAEVNWTAVASEYSQRGSRVWDVAHMVGQLPKDALDQLAARWIVDCSESSLTMVGVSLVPGMSCPRRTLRSQETTWYVPIVHNDQLFGSYMEGQFIFIFDVTDRNYWEAAFGVTQTVLLVIVLAIAALLFSRDVDRLVLMPIERMIEKVDVIRKDPLTATKLSVDNRKTPKTRAERQRMGKMKVNSNSAQLLETQILENTIIKLGSLLALGFGDAGVNIIAENMDDSQAQVTVKIPGTKVEAIFGFCDIRHFNAITEVLKERTMVFVNQVAEIVHRVVDHHLGAANKNLGQSFLLVWQFSNFDATQRSKIADLSVMAFIQVVAALSRDINLSEISAHPLLRSRMPGFRLSVGFGLHMGWAISGAIGSEFKIDASYVSPHVNLAQQLEDSTSDYGVTILMSEPLVRACDSHFRRSFRPIDYVQLPGSKLATQLFTVDLDTTYLFVQRVHRKRVETRSEVLKARETRRAELLNRSFQVHKVLETDKYVRAMRQHLSRNFFQEFERGFLNYVAGEWAVASEILARTRVMPCQRGSKEDGPSRVLTDFMASFGNEAPPNWPGWRDLSTA